MNTRLREIDFLKCICILLMILFHLVYIGDSYPLAKKFVYTFHIPIFLMLSGYLANVEKRSRLFLTSTWWIFVPYVVMELAYLVASYYLPVREGLDVLSCSAVAGKLFFNPIGPYWYLHTLIVCNMVYYVLNVLLRNKYGWFVVAVSVSSALSVLSTVTGWVSLSSVMYYCIGMALRLGGVRLDSFFKSTWLVVVPLLILMLYPVNFERFSIGGMAINYLMVSFLLYVYQYIPSKIKTITAYIGSKTLVLLLFSPLFTIAVKPLVKVFQFDPTGATFALSALTIAVSGSFFIAWLMDKMHLSAYFFGKQKIL